MHNALQKQCMDKRGLIGRVYRRHFQLNAKVYFNDVFLKRRGYVLYNECIRSHFEKKQKYYFSFIFTIPPVSKRKPKHHPTPSLKISFHLFVALNKTPYGPTALKMILTVYYQLLNYWG